VKIVHAIDNYVTNYFLIHRLTPSPITKSWSPASLLAKITNVDRF